MEKVQYSKNQSGEISRHKYYYEHIIQYVLLVISFVVAVSILFQVKDFVWKLVIVTLISLIYLSWGIWHHWEEKNLTRTHILEYLVISVLIFTVLTFVFLTS